MSTDQPLHIYKEYLHELENAISALQSDGRVLVTGDFNAHLGSLGGSRCSGITNTQGQLLFDLMCRTNMFAASLCHISSGPAYTYFSGDHHTTVDYCLLDNHAAHILQQCSTSAHHTLNFSDHLPISTELNLIPLSLPEPTNPPKTNWKRALREGSIVCYQQSVSSLLSCCPALDSADRSAALNHEITSGAKSMLQAAKSSLPLIKRRSCKKKFIDDETLRVKCTISKAAWHTWRPPS